MNRSWLLIGVAVLASGCGGNAALREEELARIADWLPGTYDNRAQVDDDLKRNIVDVHAPIELNIVAADSPIVGHDVYYVQQNDAMNPRRVLSQQLYSFEKSADDKAIAHTIYTFKEPERWVHGHDRPDIFKSLVPDDLSAATGCELKWEFKEERFTGHSSAVSCHGAGGSGAHARSEVHIELTATQLKLAERAFDAEGNIVSGRRDDPFSDFRKTNRKTQ
jgi:hypothetical protein